MQFSAGVPSSFLPVPFGNQSENGRDKSKTFKMAASRLVRISPLSSSSFFLDAVLRNNRSTFLRQTVCCCDQLSKANNSSTSRSARRNGNGRSEGRLHHLKKVLNQFVTGSKELGSDVKRLVTIRRKFKASGKDWDALSLDETLHLNQVSWSSSRPNYCIIRSFYIR